ncbi:MAG: hypothetical protein K6U02_03435 [Firmicutes bacterium]|nr:hypothetical protein [Bacillota bacterium]
MRCPRVFLWSLVLLVAPTVRAQTANPVPAFEQGLRAALAAKNPTELLRLIPILDPTLTRAILQTPTERVQVTVRALGPLDSGRLVFVRLEDNVGGHSIELFQTLGELRSQAGQAVLTRSLSVRDAATSFRIASHYSIQEMEANSGATEILDHLEIAVMRPTRWIFFLLNPNHVVSSVAIEAGSAEVFRAGNFVLLEREQNWNPGDRIRLTVRSRQRGTGTRF